MYFSLVVAGDRCIVSVRVDWLASEEEEEEESNHFLFHCISLIREHRDKRGRSRERNKPVCRTKRKYVNRFMHYFYI